jgi:hypothetical protein
MYSHFDTRCHLTRLKQTPWWSRRAACMQEAEALPMYFQSTWSTGGLVGGRTAAGSRIGWQSGSQYTNATELEAFAQSAWPTQP